MLTGVVMAIHGFIMGSRRRRLEKIEDLRF